MDASSLDLEFFDLSNASDEEIKEIRSILSDSGSNGCVELPWEVPLSLVEDELEKIDTGQCEATSTTSSSLGSVVGQALLYAPQSSQISPALAAPSTQLSLPTTEVVPQVETFIHSQMPPMSAASAMGPHYPAPYLVSQTLPYLRAYPPHVGVPLFTCALPGAGELTHVPSPYASFLPVATPLSTISQPRLDKPTDSKENGDTRQKSKTSSDRQFYHHRTRKKNLPGGSYYSSSDFAQGSDAYRDSSNSESEPLPSANGRNEHIAAVPSSLPVVPVPVSPSTFSVTSGALPMPSYPPGLHPLHYSQISGPQPPTAPLYYVPVFNHPHYSGYIPSASGHMMLPIGNVSIAPSGIPTTSESRCSVASEGTEDLAKSSESLAASVESDGKSSENSVQTKPDVDVTANSQEDGNAVTNEDKLSSVELVVQAETNDIVDDRQVQDSPDSLVESHIHGSHKLNNACCDAESAEVNMAEKVCNDSSRRWADLFKKQCTEMNGLDRKPSEQPRIHKTTNLTKKVNGKLYSVPNSDSIS